MQKACNVMQLAVMIWITFRERWSGQTNNCKYRR